MMPLYDYECERCGSRQEEFFGIQSKPKNIICRECGGSARAIITCHNIEAEQPAWLDSATLTLQNQDEVRAGRQKKIETRSEMKKYMHERGLIQTG